jgi:hypothetical protein
MEASRKRACVSKSLAEKYEIVCFVKDNPTLKQKAICEKFSIKQSTLATYLQHREKITADYESSSNSLKIKRSRKPSFENVDKALLVWFTQKRISNLWIDGETLRLKGTEFAAALGHEGAEITSSWIDRWKIRHKVSSKVMAGEKTSVDDTVVTDWKNHRLPEILRNWAPEDIYNVDETGLFWRLTPDRTLAFKAERVHGGKKAKDRVTVLVGASMSGEKLPLLVIGRFGKPRCFHGIRHIPVKYRANGKAWMTGQLFEEWVRKLDRSLTRKILLVVDNCPAHPRVSGLAKVHLLFLPPNTTSCTQPMDCGIIKNLKHIYKRKLAIKLLKAHDENVDFTFNLLDSLSLLREAWNEVTTDTVKNCFRSAGFSEMPDPQDEEEENVNVMADFGNVFERLRVAFSIPGEVDVSTFLALDDDLEVAGNLTDDDILNQLNDNTSVADDVDKYDELEPTGVSSKDGLLAARTLQQYLRQHPYASDAHCTMSQQLLSFLENEALSHMKQTKITNFFVKS